MRNNNSLLNTSSRYVQGGVSETQDNKIEWWERTIFKKDPSDQIYVIENIYQGRLDSISAVFYGDPRFWWFLAQYNNVLDPASEILPGRILLIPTKDRLQLMLTGRIGGISSTRVEVPSIPPIVI